MDEEVSRTQSLVRFLTACTLFVPANEGFAELEQQFDFLEDSLLPMHDCVDFSELMHLLSILYHTFHLVHPAVPLTPLRRRRSGTGKNRLVDRTYSGL